MIGRVLQSAAAVIVAALLLSGGAQARTTLVVGMQLEPPHLDPTAGAAAAIDEVTYTNVFEGLTRIDADGRILPSLAKSWDVSADGLTYTFHLREGASFHDGRSFYSGDVRFSFDRARGAESVNAQKGYFTGITRIETPNPRTAIIQLARADSLFLFHLGQGDAAIVAPETANTNRQVPIGTGPFRFGRWVPGDRVELTRNPAYDGAKPDLEKVTFRFISDPAAQVAALMAGDVDTFPQFGTYEALPRFRTDSRFAVITGTTEGETILAINNGRKPFDDVRVRRALSHAIDRKGLIEAAMFGAGTPIGSHFAPHNPAYIDLTGLYPYDPAKAKALLAEAGYRAGFETTLQLPPPIYARRSGELIAAMLGEVGIRVRIENIEWAAWLEKVFHNKDYDLTVIAHTEPLDIDIYGRENYYFNYHSRSFNDTLAELNLTNNEKIRNAVYGRLQRIIADDAVNAFLFQLPAITVQNAGIRGMWPNRPIQATDVTAVRWVP